jgi:hypothetical protein
MRDRIIAGDTLDFVTTFVGYPAATWTCTYYFVPRVAGSGTAFSVVCTAGTEADAHRCAAAATTTAFWAPAEYTWQARMVNGAEERSGDAWPWRGECTILANLATATAYDGRSHARKTLDAIEAVLEGRATLDQEEYTIGNRSLKRTPVEQLIRFRQRYKQEVLGEDAAARINAGLGGGRKIQVRL